MYDESVKQKVNFIGNNMKSLHLSVESSLKRLRTDYIDILYIHLVRIIGSLRPLPNRC